MRGGDSDQRIPLDTKMFRVLQFLFWWPVHTLKDEMGKMLGSLSSALCTQTLLPEVWFLGQRRQHHPGAC